MDINLEINKLIDDYIEEVKKLIANAKFGDGIFGLGSSYKNAPCHGAFYDKVAALVNELAASDPSAEEAESVAELLIKCSSERSGPDSTHWILVAIQKLAIPLIPFLSPEKKLELKGWYDKHEPKRTRLPAQEELYKALKK